MSDRYDATQTVQYRAMSAWYGMSPAAAMGIDHKVRDFEEVLYATGSTSAEALENLKKVVEGYCKTERRLECKPKNEPRVDLSGWSKIENWVAGLVK